MKKDAAEHERNQRPGSGGDALLWLEACLRAARENPRALLRQSVSEIERFCCLDLLLPPSSVTVGSLVSAGFQGGFETWGQPLTATGAMRRSRLAFLALSGLQVKASFTSVNAERGSLSSFLSAADRR